MACVSRADFSIFIYGHPSVFFKGNRRLRQGCSLSPLLFLLFIGGLSKLIEKARMDGKIGGVKISDWVSITHLLLVDDVLSFRKGKFDEWLVFKDIVSFLANAS